jgi:hypothetical protein
MASADCPTRGGVYYNCLITRQYDPVNDPTKKKRYRVEAYVATLRGEEAEVVEQPPGCESSPARANQSHCCT